MTRDAQKTLYIHTRIFALCLALTACGVSDPQPQLVGCLDPYSDVAALAAEQLEGKDPGDAALLVRIDGETVCRLFFGEYSADTKVLTVSAAKWLTAATMMALVDEGKLALDTKASAHFPDAPATTANITISQMLSHTSGLLWFSRCMGRATYTLQTCAEQTLDGDLHFEPGTGFFYSGPAFTVAGAMAERATGQSWAEIFRTRIGEPLGMSHTSFGPHANPSLSEGDVVATLDDYAHFGEMILGRGVYRGRRVLSESAIDQMRHNWTAGVTIVNSPREDVPYGLGSWLDSTDAAGRGVIVSSPGSEGFIPIVDYTRNAIIVFVAQDGRIWPAANQIIAGVRMAIDQER
jgi:CubicO group peptidase (beta-lactamase class C family)